MTARHGPRPPGPDLDAIGRFAQTLRHRSWFAAVVRVAAGAATQAAYQAAVALAARRDSEHPFAIKFRLFAAGRWPLGIVNDALYVF